jgi:DNA-binding IclR family transcriptional regulator
MACLNPDGSLTAGAKAMLEVMAGPLREEEIATRTGLPLYRVRSGLREMERAGLVSRQGEMYVNASPRSRVPTR